MNCIRKPFISIFLFLSLSLSAIGQGLMGHITNSDGQGISYAAVFVPSIHQGTTANEEGIYRLELEPGIYEIRFQYLGYKTQVHTVNIENDYVSLDVIMEDQQYALPEVVVTASGEDPAYYIMRRAIGMSQYYLNQVSEYNCRVYLKGSGVLTKIPALLRRQFEREGVEQDRYFVTETISEVQYAMPDQVQTRVISTRSSGDDNQTSPMMFITMSLYQDINGIISPLSRNAFQVYRFQLEGSFMENGTQVNKIKVIPRRAGHDLYSGHIFIKDGTWSLHSVDLQIEQSLFTAGIRQVYNPVADGVWMPVSHNYHFRVGIMGLELEYKYLATVSDYEITLNPNVDHEFYNQVMAGSTDAFLLQLRDAELDRKSDVPEIGLREQTRPQSRRQQQISELMATEDLNNREMRRLNRLIRREARANEPRRPLEVRNLSMEMDDSARVRTSTYWAENRPVPLTPQEMESFTELPQDTVEKETPRRGPLRKVLTGGTHSPAEKWTFRYNGLVSLSSFDFNTVDGLKYSKTLSLGHSGASGRQFTIANTSGYAFARERFLTRFDLNYAYHPFRRASFNLEGGRRSQDFDANHGIHPTVNAISSLFFQNNFLKLYEKDYVRILHRFDVVNGLVLTTAAEYAQRRPLENHTDFSIAGWMGGEYTPNIPAIPGLETLIMPVHNAFVIDAKLSYTHRHYYMRIGERKVMLSSRWPTVSLAYREGIEGILNSDTRFRQFEASVNQSLSVKMVGEFSYRINVGRFFNTDKLFTPDFRHFSSNSTWFMSGTETDRFRTLNHYEYSTGTEYLSAHLNYEHGRILLKRLPFLARTLSREKLFFSALSIPEDDFYFEIGYGMNQIFLLINAEIVSGFKGGKHHYTGFRISVPLGGEASVRL
ncbi:MAG: DUF5686 and carboxypeptidase regulatory-like domain-containing protein [Bacteroidales bacterium]|nr:DUF5686 and carboxypeptidase regulatory-like domain-containing protein [Bacteroidales bacterium]